jgi:hypothetical protein
MRLGDHYYGKLKILGINILVFQSTILTLFWSERDIIQDHSVLLVETRTGYLRTTNKA